MKKALLLSAFALFALLTNAQKLPFQGKLIESGTPVNGTRSFTFVMDTTWTETHSNVSVTDGLYFVVLGSINPLPSNLFYANDERQLSISVDGTALGPVTLFKPLSTPLEGNQVTVKNDEGTVVGKMAVTSDSQAKNGEIKVFGTNGSENVSLSGFSHYQTPGNNFGTIWVSDDTGNPRAHFMISPYRGVHGTGELSMAGESAGWYSSGFNTYNNVFNYPYLALDLNSATATMKVASADTIDYGEITLRSSNNDENLSTPSRLIFKQNGVYKAQTGVADWETKDFGFFELWGPNSHNFYLGAKSWESHSDVPYMALRGTDGNDIVSLEGFADDPNTPENDERGQLNLMNKNGKYAAFSAGYLAYHTPERRTVALESANWGNGDFGRLELVGTTPHVHLNDVNGTAKAIFEIAQSDQGQSGSINLMGPNSGNFWMGGQSWIPGKGADRPLFSMTGSADQPVFSVECSNDDTNEEAIVHLYSQIGNQANLYPTLFEMKDANRTYSTFRKSDWGNGSFGMIELAGPNSSNFEFSSFGGNPDRGYMALRGANGNNMVEMFANENNGIEYGQIVTSNINEVRSVVTNDEFLLTKPDWSMLASLHNGGDYGQLTLRGPNTQNFYIGSENWGDHDVPYMNMNGKDDQPKMYITTVDDVNGERGIITLSNSNGDETTYGNNGTWGTGPFNMWSGAMVNGVLTINGDIQGSGTNNYNSDRRLKKDIQPLGSNMLGKITQLGGYSYYWRKDEFPKKNFSHAQQIGLIAQELEEQFPALVKTGDDGYKSVNYNGFTAVLLEAVKELNAKVDKLESDNNRLQAQLSASAEKSDEMATLKKQVDLLTKLVQENMAGSSESEKTAAKN